MFAVVQAGGRQYRVAEGDTILVDAMDAAVGAAIELDRVLLVGQGESVKVGAPTVAGAKVAAEVVGHELGDKRITYKFRRTRRYRRIRGFRPQYTSLRITSITA
jgi:large subunit ribosomal protein L21